MAGYRLPVCSMPYDAYLRATTNPEGSVATEDRAYVNHRGYEVDMMWEVANVLGFRPDFLNPPDQKKVSHI
jgi:hypothetical protein